MSGFYIYVDSFDHNPIYVHLMKCLNEISQSYSGIMVVDEKEVVTGDLMAGDLPEWRIGLNFKIKILDEEFYSSLISIAKDLEIDFVFGYYNDVYSEDLFYFGFESEKSIDEIKDLLIKTNFN